MPIRYFGAQRTGRFAAGDDREDEHKAGKSFNAQNQYREAMHGIDLRDLFEAPPGFVFGIFDYDQIEARVLQWRAGNDRMLEMIRKEGNVYQAYAKSAGLYQGTKLKKDNFDLYQFCKVCVLLLGYQGGASKFRTMSAKKYGVVMSQEKAEQGKNEWRAANPEVVAFWARHQEYLHLSNSHRDKCHEIEMASGRILRYWHPQWHKSISKEGKVSWDIYTSAYETGPGRKTYGGLITENEIQATARDILRDGWIQVCKEFGRDLVRLSVHDELVTLLPEDKAAAMAPRIAECMTAATHTWAKGCPISVTDLKLAKTYTKED
jgi:DNA polymerase